MRWLLPMSALILSSCLRSAGVPPDPLEDDKSIVFPMFFGVKGTELGDEGKQYRMDGRTLRALMVASHDYLPSNPRDKSCWNYPEGHRYEIIRKGEIIFIEIGTDFINCDDPFIMFDDGAVYAISSTDGRILRRLFEGHPDYPNPLRLSSDAGVSGPKEDRDISDLVGYTGFVKENLLFPSWLDGGFPDRRKRAAPSPSSLDGGSRPDGGVQDDGGVLTPSAPLEANKSIVLPRFSEFDRTKIGEWGGKLYSVDGPTLRALMVAFHDYPKPGPQDKSCWNNPEGYRYDIIRQGEIIFIEMSPDLIYCNWPLRAPPFMAVDAGTVYAINTDGRILRRLVEGDPDCPNPVRLPSDGGMPSDGGIPTSPAP